jgi:hypothetical protein
MRYNLSRKLSKNMGSEGVHERRGRSSRDRGTGVTLPTLCAVCTFLALVAVLTVVNAARDVDGGDDMAAIFDLVRTLVRPAVLLFVVACFEQPLVGFFSAVTVSA